MILENQDLLRSAVSLSGLILFFTLGLVIPFHKSSWHKNSKRWAVNLFFSLGNGILVRFLIPLGLAGLVSLPIFKNLRIVAMPESLTLFNLLYGVLFLDLVIYWQHRLTHQIPLLWRLHRMHHSDPALDATSAGRFHPLEILMSFGVKLVFSVAFGVRPEAIVVFEIVLNFSSLFNHCNIQFPRFIENNLQKFIITPDIHRIHHSIEKNEMNRNFGFSICLWDQIFNTYKNKASKRQEDIKLGLPEFSLKSDQSLLRLLIQPFLKN